MNRAKFLQNGKCGYILKPEFMAANDYNLGEETEDKKAVTLLSLRLISGQHLPNASDRQAGDIIEPYVKIKIHGHPVDTAVWVSSVVPRNGFNPLWEETAEFEITYPELALLEFKVKSRAKVVGGQEAGLGGHLISLALVRSGYRHVQLQTIEGVRLTPACLFLRINRQQLGRNTAR